MRVLRVISGASAALLGNALLVGAAYTVGNYLFEWHMNKVSVEWQTTLFFAGIYSALGVLATLFAAVVLRGVARAVTLSVSGIALFVGWCFVCILSARMNPGYLWLLVGVPVVAGYFLVRGAQHLRARAA